MYKNGDRVITTVDYPGIGNNIKGIILDHQTYGSLDDLYRIRIGDGEQRWINSKYLELDKEYYREQKLVDLLSDTQK